MVSTASTVGEGGVLQNYVSSVWNPTDEIGREVLQFPPMPPPVIPAAVTQRVKDIKDLIDDLVVLAGRHDPFAVELSSRIKHEVDALVRSVRQLQH